jgi:hypothetical protein
MPPVHLLSRRAPSRSTGSSPPSRPIRRAQIPIEHPAPPHVPHHGFLPWRFSYAGRRSMRHRSCTAGIRKSSQEPTSEPDRNTVQQVQIGKNPSLSGGTGTTWLPKNAFVRYLFGPGREGVPRLGCLPVRPRRCRVLVSGDRPATVRNTVGCATFDHARLE